MVGMDIKQSFKINFFEGEDMTTINVKKEIKDSFSSISGHKLGRRLVESIKKRNIDDKNLSIDFSNISPFTSLFFNAMFEELMVCGDLKKVVNGIMINNLSELDMKTYQRCLEAAIEHQVKLNAN